MPTKILTGTYSAGYTLSAAFTRLTLTSTAQVSGVTPATYGYAGGVGLTLAFAAPVNSAASLIAGGTGRFGEISGGMTKSGSGGAGGNAVDLGGGGTFTNSGSVAAGAGGAGAFGFGGGDGGAGGVGISLGAAGEVDSSWRIGGGAGGSGGSGTYGGAGGAGGVALDFAAGGVVTNASFLFGGDGGVGGDRATTIAGKGSAGNGGHGGAGIAMTQRGTVTNTNGGEIIAGVGGHGGAGGNAYVSAGRGGDGVSLAGGGMASNAGVILGGSSGTNGRGGAGVNLQAAGSVANSGEIVGGQAGSGGQGGLGVWLAYGGHVSNSDTGFIAGGYGGSNGHGGSGVLTGASATLDNFGNIYGGGSAPGGGPGIGAYIESGAIYNGGFIRGGEGGGSYQGDGVVIRGGSLTNGGASHATAHIYGSVGVFANYQVVTVTNRGTIGGQFWSVELMNIADRLIVGAGAVFQGPVRGGGVLELAAGNETITGMGGATVTVSGSTPITMTDFRGYVIDAAASLTFVSSNVLNAGDTLTSSGALSLAPGASLTVINGATVQVQGALANAGSIALVSSDARTDLRVLGGGASLTGGGMVNVTGTRARILGATSTTVLTNVDNTIKGSGFLGVSELELVNKAAGVIDAIGTLTVHTSGPSLANAGLLESSAGGLLALVSTTIDNSGGGLIDAYGKINLQNDTIIGGTFATSGTGLIRLNSGASTLDAKTSAVSLIGELQVKGATTLTATGVITDSGKLNIYSGKLIVGSAGLTLSGGGQVNLNDSAKNIIIGATATAALTNVGGGSMSLVNGGVIVDTQAQALTIDTGTHTIQNSGIIEADGKGGVTVTSAVHNTGTLLAVVGTLTLDGAVTGAGVGKVNGGTLFAKSTFTENVTFGTTGTLVLAHGQTYTGKITGFSKTGTNALDLRDIGFTSGVTKASYSGSTASGTLTVTNGTHTAHITLTGNYTASTFTTASDGHGGVIVKDPPASAAPLSQAMAALGANRSSAVWSTVPPRAPAAHMLAATGHSALA
jgi:hypothetical protein